MRRSFSFIGRNSAETTRYVAEQYSEIKELLTELGLAKAPAK